MKSIFTLVMSCLMAVSVFAADVAGRITVSFTGNKDYKVLIDGRAYEAGSGNRIYLRDIRPGRHTIEVYNTKTKNNRKNARPVYAGSFTVRPNRDMDIWIDRNGRAEFDESRNNDRRYDRNDRNWNDRNRDWDRNDDRNKGGGYNDYYNRAMSDYDFNRLEQSINQQWRGKLSTAKDGIKRNSFTTYQVKQLLLLFSSENDKLELAKLAYDKTVDRQNYNQLYEVFSSRSSHEELDRFIRNNRR